MAVNFFENCRNALVNRISLRVATYSYALYLTHVPTLHLVFNVWRPRSLVLGILAFAEATLSPSYRLLEGPLVALGRRLSETGSLTPAAPEVEAGQPTGTRGARPGHQVTPDAPGVPWSPWRRC